MRLFKRKRQNSKARIAEEDLQSGQIYRGRIKTNTGETLTFFGRFTDKVHHTLCRSGRRGSFFTGAPNGGGWFEFAEYDDDVPEDIQLAINEEYVAKKIQNSFKVGDIIYDKWGYSMRLYDFYKVISRTRSTVTLVKLKQTTKRLRDGDFIAAPTNETDGKPFRKKIMIDDSIPCEYVVIQGSSGKYTGQTLIGNDYD